jgi:carbamoyl-phosphate synthase large subunit
MRLLAEAEHVLNGAGIRLVANDRDVVAKFSNKADAFRELARLGIPTPETRSVSRDDDIIAVGLPCIIKPATGSGGSAMVYYAVDLDEARVYVDYIRRMGGAPLAQEYIDVDEGEFTVGVLSWPDGTVVSSIALRRSLESKLSVLYQGRGGLVSTGYTQGYIGEFGDICRQAEAIAISIGSRGPINVQGRVRDGVLVPFEINPRLSASSYLRALAGRNELHSLLQKLAYGAAEPLSPLREGWYLRSLTEQYVAPDAMRK